jgi:hypothetical protein
VSRIYSVISRASLLSETSIPFMRKFREFCAMFSASGYPMERPLYSSRQCKLIRQSSTVGLSRALTISARPASLRPVPHALSDYP